MNYKEVVKNLKAKDWKQVDNITNVVVMTKGFNRIMVDKSEKFDTVGYIVDNTKTKEHLGDGELEDIMDVFKLDEVYGK